jgi:hypothetical protein
MDRIAMSEIRILIEVFLNISFKTQTSDIKHNELHLPDAAAAKNFSVLRIGSGAMKCVA